MIIDRDAGTMVVQLGQLALMLGRVDRITFHEDGSRPETDTDHTVMLGLVATSFAARYLPQLDLGLVAQYAFIHDLPEAHAGDTPTLRITPLERIKKRERERKAIERIDDEFGWSLPWVTDVIANYEAQKDAESRYVKAMDKLVPKITHILNQGRALTRQGYDRNKLRVRYEQQFHEMERYAADFPALFELREQLLDTLYATVPWKKEKS